MVNFFCRKFKLLISDKRFSEILAGSVWSLAARVLATCLWLLTSIIIARKYGAEMVGIVSVIQAFLMFVTIFTVFGTNTSILRLIPEHVAKYSVASAFKVYRKIQYFVVGGSVLAGGLFFFASDLIAARVFEKPHLSSYFALASGVLVFKSLMDLNTGALRGLRLIKIFAFMEIVPAAVALLGLFLMTLLHVGRNSPVYAHMAAWGATAIVGVLIMDYSFRKRVQTADRIHSTKLSEILNISTPMLMTASMQFVIGQTGVLLLGIFRSESEVGYYAVAVKLACLTSFVLNAINSIAAPKFSELYHIGEMDELFYVARKSTKLIFWTTIPILCVLLIFGFPILDLIFGEEFKVAYPAMVILVFGQFVNSISGSTAYFMNMTGHQKILFNIMLISGMINVALSFLLIPICGIFGAACAGTICLVIWNTYVIFYIKKKYGKSIGYLPLLIKRQLL